MLDVFSVKGPLVNFNVLYWRAFKRPIFHVEQMSSMHFVKQTLGLGGFGKKNVNPDYFLWKFDVSPNNDEKPICVRIKGGIGLSMVA